MPLSPLAALILSTTLVRLAFAWAIGLGVDESYMVTAGRVLSLGYFDHPPASWWLSWGAAHLAGTEAAVVVRLPFVLLFALSTWLVARIGTRIADARAGLWAAVALNLSPVFGVTTGSWVLPDGPLDAALLGAVLCLLHALPARRGWGPWIGAGLCAGLALGSKYSAVLTIGGLGLYLLSSPVHRRWLLRPQPWAAMLVAAAVFSPVIIWNATNGWASFAFQGDRALGLRFRPLEPLTVLGGEALFVLPWIWAPLLFAAWRALRRGPATATGDWTGWLLCCLAAPPILGFALIAAWSDKRILYHWAAPGYLMLFPLLGREIAARIDQAWVRRTLIGTAALLLAAIAVIGTQERLDWLGPQFARLRKDPTAEGLDWTSLRTELDARGLLPPGTVVGVPNWRDAGKIGRALGPEVPIVVLDRDARQFGIVRPAASMIGRSLLVLVVEHPAQVAATLAPRFAALTPLPPAPVSLRGRVLLQVAPFRGEDFHGLP
ncbi:MAG: glycosyltransferase family 39 protein [Rhodospirillales bacterium]|nr:glycosyltransferase family 39 protein [Rhodospirillales bacterium]